MGGGGGGEERRFFPPSRETFIHSPALPPSSSFYSPQQPVKTKSVHAKKQKAPKAADEAGEAMPAKPVKTKVRCER